MSITSAEYFLFFFLIFFFFFFFLPSILSKRRFLHLECFFSSFGDCSLRNLMLFCSGNERPENIDVLKRAKIV